MTDTRHYGVVDDRQSPQSPAAPPGHDVLERLKTLVWQATDDTALWEQIVLTAIDYAHARAIAAIERVGR